MSNKARRSRIVKPDVLVVGIDVVKRRHVAVCRRPDGFKEKPFAFANHRSGFEKLLGKSEDAKCRTRNGPKHDRQKVFGISAILGYDA